MKALAKAGLLALLTTPLIAGVLWIGSTGSGQTAAPASVAGAQATGVAAATSSPLISTQAGPAAKPAIADSAPPVKVQELSREQRRFIVDEFVKAADKDIAKVQRALDEAKAGGAPAEQIAVQENKLRMMQQFKLATLARNAAG